MARDKTPAELIESVLYHFGVANRGEVAQAITEELGGMLPQVIPTQGDMGPEEHNAFLLRIFMHLVSVSGGSTLTVDLNDVLKSTSDRTMLVKLDNNMFTAQVIKIPEMRN